MRRPLWPVAQPAQAGAARARVVSGGSRFAGQQQAVDSSTLIIALRIIRGCTRKNRNFILRDDPHFLWLESTVL